MPSPTWLDRATAARDWQMVNAYLDEQLGPIALPCIEPDSTYLDRLWMRYSLLSLVPLPSATTMSRILITGC